MNVCELDFHFILYFSTSIYISVFLFICRAASRNRPSSVDAENSEASKENDNSEEKEDAQSQEAESPSSSYSSASRVASCFGGVLALDGRDGHTLWETYAGHEVYAITCEHDLNRDNVTDCVAAGRYGAFLAINAADGSILWTFSAKKLRPHSNANMQCQCTRRKQWATWTAMASWISYRRTEAAHCRSRRPKPKTSSAVSCCSWAARTALCSGTPLKCRTRTRPARRHRWCSLAERQW